MAKELKTKKEVEPHKIISIPPRPLDRARGSKRLYPERECMNPECQYGSFFVPHDKRQLYCCRQCGTDHRNDKRAEANRTKYADEKMLRKTDKQLELLYAAYHDGKQCAVHISVFQVHKINLRYSVIPAPVTGTGNRISWLYEYGFGRDPDNKEYLFIHKRKIQNV